MVKSALEYAKKICYSSEETLMFSYRMAIKYKDMPGIYCEAGVAAGAQIIAMHHGAPDKIIYAFDSFQGIPKPSNRDDQMPGIRRLSREEISLLPPPGDQEPETTGATSVSEENFIANLTHAGVDMDKIKIVPGWFEHTVRLFGSQYVNISILRLDGDLYNSTFVCLQHLFGKVQTGGCVIIDDIQLAGCKAACEDYFGHIGYTPQWQYVSNIAFFYK